MRPPRLALALFRHHVFGALTIVVIATLVIADQVEHRDDFASGELSQGVESRWGAPVTQPAPSLRFVESGSIFTTLSPLAFSSQRMHVDAEMNYRKRGLRYFSGFDFLFEGVYTAENTEAHDIDVAFVFPITVDKSQVLLSELMFTVNGKPASLDLGAAGDRLLWTGRVQKGEKIELAIGYRARGLNSFIYRLDPALPAKGVVLDVNVNGGENFDYPDRVLSATRVEQRKDGFTLGWSFQSLESGVALGVTLPSLMSFDTLIATMARRAWCPFLCVLGLLVVLALRHTRRLLFYEVYLIAAVFGFFFVLLAYLAAFMSFYAAYALSVALLGAVFVLYLRVVFPSERKELLAGAWVATLVVPTVAVILQGYTGLIYTLEIFGALVTLMVLSQKPMVRALLATEEAT